MTARNSERCPKCNSHLTLNGHCPECDKVTNLSEHTLLTTKDEKQTKENSPVEGQVLSLRKRKKQSVKAFLFNQTTAERHVLTEALTRIGRDRSNNVSIKDDPYISRHHAWLVQAEGGFWIEDLGSTNTTLLNGQPITERRQINAGDRLTFGKTELVFFAEK